jgi:steroid delta-isomerase
MMQDMNLVDRFHHFLACYALKDLPAISRMLAEDVTLRDWDIAVQGRAAVEQATLSNFLAARSIAIEVLAVYERSDAVAGELRILVDGEIELFVVDVIRFDAEGRVAAIRSYKGRAD